MLADTNDRPNVEEQYETASNTSNLAVETHVRRAADVLIAAGWSPATLGGAIMRMHSEFSRPPRNGGQTDVILAMNQLKTMPSVVQQIEIRALIWGMEEALEKARGVVAWWLDRVCQKCSGRGMQLIPGTPALSNRVCPSCRGSREAKLPHGQEGRRLATYMDSCVADWHGSMKTNLAAHRRARNKVVETATGRVIMDARNEG